MSDVKLDPMKYKNKKLTKENNELHYQLMKLKEDTSFKDIKWKTVFKSLEDEKRDLKFLLSQKENTQPNHPPLSQEIQNQGPGFESQKRDKEWAESLRKAD